MSMGQLRLAARLARREMRAGLRGLWVFILCLTLGVAAIAAVGMLRSAINAGLQDQAAVLLGGDAQVELTYRFATDAERQVIEARAARVSEIVDFRSMVVVGDDRALAQVKAVDAAYPLTGEVGLDPAIPLSEALAVQDGHPGAVIAPDLAARLGLKPGDRFDLGTITFRLGAILTGEPDATAAGITLGPRVLVRTADLQNSGLLVQGSLFRTAYRMTLSPDADLGATRAALMADLEQSGARWTDIRRPAPEVARFVDRLGAFLVLVGLAGLAVGGVGISATMRAWFARKTETIATLKVLGADTGLVFRIYLLQAGAMACAGILAGLLIGAGLPVLLAPVIEAALPFPAAIAPYPRPLIEAAFYGLMTALVFSLWPLAQAARLRAAALYRGGAGAVRPGIRALMALVLSTSLLIGGAIWSSGQPGLAGWTLAAIAASLGVLVLVAAGLSRLARWLSALKVMRGRVALRAGLAAIAAQPAESRAVILSLGLGLTVLSAVGQIDANLRSAITRELPGRAPSFFFIDIQPDQIAPFRQMMADNPAVDQVAEAPMLRGIIARINDRPAREVAGSHWVLNGDRGITYSAEPPGGTRLTAGRWWPNDYTGPAQISFAATEAAELGLKLGDRLTVNVLGRDIEAEITSFREVDFSTGGIGFIMSMSPNALAGAPHTFIATVHADRQAEPAILRAVGQAWPNVTAISIREAAERVGQALGQIATATSIAAGVVLVTGFVVLIGAAAAGEPARIHEAAVLRVLGATRRRILLSFALRGALMGAAAGLVAVLAGAVAAWATLHFVMEVSFHFQPGLALGIVATGILFVLVAGAVFARRPLRLPPARVLRSAD